MRYSDNFGYRSIEDDNTNPLVREIEERLKDPFLRTALLEKNSFQTHKKWKKPTGYLAINKMLNNTTREKYDEVRVQQ